MVQGVPGWFEDELETRDGDSLLRVTQQGGGKARARARAEPLRGEEREGEGEGTGTLEEDATPTSASRS